MRKKCLFDSIFWKLFLLIWLASVLVTSFSSFYIIHVSQKKLSDSRFADQTRIYTALIVKTVEQNTLKTGTLEVNSADHFKYGGHTIDKIAGANKLLTPKLRRTNIRIYTQDGQKIYQRSKTDPANARIREFNVTSDSGQKYRVKTWTPQKQHWFPSTFRRLHAFQFIALMLGAALVSLIATILIQNPINTLRNYTRSLSRLDFNQHLGTRILRRKDTIGELARTVDDMAKNIGSMIDTRQSLLNDVSHELRAPLARLQTAVALIEQSAKIENNPHIQRVHRECERMNQLIARIITFNNVGNTVSTTVFPLNQLVQQAVEDCRYHYPHRNICWQNGAKLAVAVSADSALLGSTVQNIIENACRHTPAAAPIEVGLEVKGTRIVLTIRDYGPGIDETEKKKLLQPFYRANQQMHTEGFGLGLSIVERTLAHCGGKLALRNHPSGGLKVMLSIPLAETDSGVTEQAQTELQQEATKGGYKQVNPNILNT